jgi:MarR family transcriptional regulator, organic hydroperoxide resistance regulator
MSATSAIGTDGTPVLDDQLCLALYRASRAMTAAYRPLLEGLGLTYPQYLVMSLLWEDGACSVGDIGRRLHLESNTLSPLIKRLESVGLLTRRRRVEDERVVLVEVTAKGRRLQSRAAGVPAQICAATGLDDAGSGRLVRRLRQLAEQLEAAPQR